MIYVLAAQSFFQFRTHLADMSLTNDVRGRSDMVMKHKPV